MRKAEIVPGQLVALHSRYTAPRPAVILSADLYTVGAGGQRHKAGPGSRISRRESYSRSETGYLVARPDGYAPAVEAAKRTEYLRAIDPSAAIERWLAGKGEAPGITVSLVTTLAPYHGGYDAEHAAYAAQQEAKAKASRDREKARQAAQERAQRAIDGLNAAVGNLSEWGTAGRVELKGLHAQPVLHTDAYSVRMTVEDAEALAGLLREVEQSR